MNWNNFVGTASPAQVNHLVTPTPWGNVFLPQVPFNAVNYPPTYLFAIGSANISNPTISSNGIVYNAGFDLYRLDDNRIDVDNYLIHPYRPGLYTIHFTKPPYHHLQSINQVPSEVSLAWRRVIHDKLK